MAKIVLGLATSHGPMLSTPPEEWHQRVLADRQETAHPFRGGIYNFDELVSLRADEHIERQITLEVWRQRHAACQRAIAELSDVFAETAPDVAVIIGDDQMEIFGDLGIPALSVYYGETIANVPFTAEQRARLEPGMAIAERGHHGATEEHLPGLPSLARHLIRHAIACEFDVAAAKRLPSGGEGPISGIPHAYGFIYRQIMRRRIVPSVPVFINTFFPPNQPSARRCLGFGKTIASAIESWDDDRRVAVIASGGMSHFVIDEALDRNLIEAIRTGDEAAMLDIPDHYFSSGTSEVKNWMAVAGALIGSGLEGKLVDYVPCYRSLAGTGTAQGFAYWR